MDTKNLSDSWRESAMKLSSFTDEQLIDELRYRNYPDIRELSKENTSLKNKLDEVLHYVFEMVDYAKDEESGAIELLIRWIRCLTDADYRKQFGEQTKKFLWKNYKIKA